MKIKIKKIHPQAIVPKYHSNGAAGFDLHACETCVIQAGKIGLIKTGLTMAIEGGFELQIRPRSGLAFKNSISVLNAPGTIDSDYRGEIGVLLINHSQVDFVVYVGDRIAQGIIAQVFQAHFEECNELDSTQRGINGFGSSGIR